MSGAEPSLSPPLLAILLAQHAEAEANERSQMRRIARRRAIRTLTLHRLGVADIPRALAPETLVAHPLWAAQLACGLLAARGQRVSRAALSEALADLGCALHPVDWREAALAAALDDPFPALCALALPDHKEAAP